MGLVYADIALINLVDAENVPIHPKRQELIVNSGHLICDIIYEMKNAKS